MGMLDLNNLLCIGTELKGRAGLLTNEKWRSCNGGGEMTTPPAGRGVRSLISRRRWQDFGIPGFGDGPSLGHRVSRPYLQRLHDRAANAASLRAPGPPSLRNPVEEQAGEPGLLGLREEGASVPYSFLHTSVL